jgi:hypothetical protein
LLKALLISEHSQERLTAAKAFWTGGVTNYCQHALFECSRQRSAIVIAH